MATISFSCCFSAASVDVIDPEESITKDMHEIKLEKLIKKLKCKLESIDLVNENSNDIVKNLAEDPEDFLDNIELLKGFNLREILKILKAQHLDKGISNGVAKVLKIIYYSSLENDPTICNLANFLKDNIVIFQDMFEKIKNRKNKAVRKIESIEQKLKKLNKLNKKQKVQKLVALLQDSVFIFSYIQDILDEQTLRRLDDYLKYKGIQLDVFFPGYVFTLIKSNIALIEKVVKLQNRIARELDFLNTLANINFIEKTESSNLSKNMLISCYSPQLYQAAFEYTVELVYNSYDTNQRLQEKLAEIGFVQGSNSIRNFLGHANFNRFLESYFSEDPTGIDDLVNFFLDSLREKIDKLPPSLERRSKIDQKNILLSSFRSLEITFEDL